MKMLLSQEERIFNKIDQLFTEGSSKEIADTYSMLDRYGIANGAFQNYHLLSLILELQKEIIATKKEMETHE